MWNRMIYLLNRTKFLIPSVTTVLFAFSYLLGSYFLWFPFVVVTVSCLIAECIDFGPVDDNDEHALLKDWATYCNIFAILLHMGIVLWIVSPYDLLGFGEALKSIGFLDVIEAKSQNTFIHYLGLSLSFAVLIAATASNTAHELIHRRDVLNKHLSNLMSAMSFDIFMMPVAHNALHHPFVGTPLDPGTPFRNEGLWRFIGRSHSEGLKQCLRIESKRLRKKGWFARITKNQIFLTTAISIAYCVLFLAASGLTGLIVLSVAAIVARLLHDVVNYVQHYGLVRVTGTPIRHDHSWNYNNPLISGYTLNLNRQAHHHVASALPFWKLTNHEARATMPQGFVSSFFLAVIPSVWIKSMQPSLKHWDDNFATEDEKALINSGRVTIDRGLPVIDKIINQKLENASQFKANPIHLQSKFVEQDINVFVRAFSLPLIFVGGFLTLSLAGLIFPISTIADKFLDKNYLQKSKKGLSPILTFLMQLWSIAWFGESMWGASLSNIENLDQFIQKIPSKKRRKRLRKRLDTLDKGMTSRGFHFIYSPKGRVSVSQEHIKLAWNHCRRTSSNVFLASSMFLYHLTVFATFPLEMIEVRDSHDQLIMLSTSVTTGSMIFDLQFAVDERFSTSDLWWFSYVAWVRIAINRECQVINLLPTLGGTKYLAGCYPLPAIASLLSLGFTKDRLDDPLAEITIDHNSLWEDRLFNNKNSPYHFLSSWELVHSDKENGFRNETTVAVSF